MTYESKLRDLAPLSLSFLAIALIVVIGVMANPGPAADGPAGGPPVADAGPDVAVDAGDNVRLDGTGSTDDGGIARWEWTFTYEGEGVSLEGAVVTFAFDVPGTYPVILKVTDTDGVWSTDAMVVTVRDAQ